MALADYDIEDFIEATKTLLLSDLNTYITSMNSIKSTGPSLDTINSNAYFIQNLSESVVSYSNFVFIFEDSMETQVNGPANSQQASIVVAIISPFKNEAQNFVAKRVFRYRKVLMTLFQEKWESLRGPIDLNVQGLSPFPVALVNSDDPMIAIGVNLEVTIAP